MMKPFVFIAFVIFLLAIIISYQKNNKVKKKMTERKILRYNEIEEILAKHFNFDEATLIKDRLDNNKNFRHSNIIEFIFHFRNNEDSAKVLEPSKEINQKAGFHYGILFMTIFLSTVLIAIGFAWAAPFLVLIFGIAHYYDWENFKEKNWKL